MLIGREDAADAGFGAVGGVGGGGPALPIRQRGAGAGESGYALLDLGKVLADQVADVRARGVPGIADGQDGADLGQA